MYKPIYLERIEQAHGPGSVPLDGVGNPADPEAKVGQDKVGGTFLLSVGLPDRVEHLVLVDVARVLVVVSGENKRGKFK